MNDDRLLLDVRTWLKDEDVVVPDADEAGRLVAARLPQTRQLRRKWWPLPSFKRTPSPAPTIRDTENLPTPIPGTNGQSSTITRRTQSMFSPAKAITAGALVFALGGVLLIAQPFGQQGTSVPGAATDAEPEEVSGQWLGFDCDVDPDYCLFEWAMSDSRLEGSFKAFATDWRDAEVNPVSFGYLAYVIENDGGTWRGLPDAMAIFPDEGGQEQDMVFEGEGGYEGLTLIAEFKDHDTTGLEMRGYIIDDTFPLPPDFAATD